MTQAQIAVERELARADLLTRCRNPEHGDYQSAVALRLAKQYGMDPMELAQKIVDWLNK